MDREHAAPNVWESGSAHVGTVLPALAAILFGMFLLWGVGFAHSNLIHDAAHDSRHSFAFPCH